MVDKIIIDLDELNRWGSHSLEGAVVKAYAQLVGGMADLPPTNWVDGLQIELWMCNTNDKREVQYYNVQRCIVGLLLESVLALQADGAIITVKVKM